MDNICEDMDSHDALLDSFMQARREHQELLEIVRELLERCERLTELISRGELVTMRCPICYESEDMMSTKCGHLLCGECWRRMQSGPDGKKCPKCRSVLRSNGSDVWRLYMD